MGEDLSKRLSRRTCIIALAAISCFLAGQPADAQILYGSIVGNVKDSSDAPVPGAVVSVVSHGTNLSRETTTNEVGAYSLPTLPPGSYDVKVIKEGFQTFTRTGVEVTINTVTRADVGLQVGSVTESITVAAGAATLQTDRAEVRAELAGGSLQNIALAVGRNYQQMFLTIPGMGPPQNTSSIPGSPSRPLQVQVNGTTSNSSVMRIDGATNTNVYMSMVAAYVPALESIETVDVVTNSFDAEQGLASGAARQRPSQERHKPTARQRVRVSHRQQPKGEAFLQSSRCAESEMDHQ